jgi:hypothetical protein
MASCMAGLCMIVSCVGVDCPDKDECLLPHDVWAVKRQNHMSFYWLLHSLLPHHHISTQHCAFVCSLRHCLPQCTFDLQIQPETKSTVSHSSLFLDPICQRLALQDTLSHSQAMIQIQVYPIPSLHTHFTPRCLSSSLLISVFEHGVGLPNICFYSQRGPFYPPSCFPIISARLLDLLAE